MTYRAASLLKPFIAVPPNVLTQQQVKDNIGPVFGLDSRRLSVMLGVVENSRVDKRHLAFPMEHVIEPRPLSQVNRMYQEKAIELGRGAARGALDSAGLAPQEIDLLIKVSCTGIMIPSIDAFLINDLGMRRDTRRLPVTESGCAAGAAHSLRRQITSEPIRTRTCSSWQSSCRLSPFNAATTRRRI